ncbi:hypothetical protein ACJMK2_033750 [Sinanodonta woodiana]|uniref:Uncharacterized protein n=1 Tax=Sinanodonta woodiana TaxID=1069815 RepID=A0ABD3WPD2_SINWO
MSSIIKQCYEKDTTTMKARRRERGSIATAKQEGFLGHLTSLAEALLTGSRCTGRWLEMPCPDMIVPREGLCKVTRMTFLFLTSPMKIISDRLMMTLDVCK